MLITAGPTREYLDPIRYMTNASSGAMGFALAAAARGLGAKVTVISGPTALPSPRGVTVVPVVSAREMRAQTLKRSRACALVIGAAAVSDWRFAAPSRHKIKRRPGTLRLTVVPNPDIIKDAASRRRPGQIFVGFALETRHAAENARSKLVRKGLDMIVANGPENLASGRARVTLVSHTGVRSIPAGPKSRVARAIVVEAVKLLEL